MDKREVESAEKRFCRSTDKFVDLKKSEKVIFRFDNIDPHVCKKVLASMSMKHFNLENIIP